MPSLKETKRRISSVKNTQKITRAMKLVSSAKYARAHKALSRAEPYRKALAKSAALLQASQEQHVSLCRPREVKKCLFLVISSDRGLCGALNTSLLKLTAENLQTKKQSGIVCDLMLWGKRAVLMGQKRSETAIAKLEKVLEKPNFEFAADAAAELCALFENGEYDEIYIGYSHFQSALTQRATVTTLLPLSFSDVEMEAKEDTQSSKNMLIEPSGPAFVNELMQKYVSSRIYSALLHGSASEHAARMAAMDSATNNADEVIRTLTLAYNRARQAAITKELIEITSGVEAL